MPVLAEKDAEITALQKQVAEYKATNTDLRTQLEAAKAGAGPNATTLESIRASLTTVLGSFEKGQRQFNKAATAAGVAGPQDAAGISACVQRIVDAIVPQPQVA